MAFVVIYVTHKDKSSCQKIISHLLKKKLIACANMFPIQSSYWWKGKVEGAHEVVSLLKTKSENWEKVKNEIKSLHSYDTPCIMKMRVEANEEYEQWINDWTE